MTRRLLPGFLLLAAGLLAGCTGVPSPPEADSPLELERTYQVPFDQTWDHILAFAGTDGMKVITSDKPSGEITLLQTNAAGAKLYYNLLLEQSEDGQTTTVYAFQHRSSGGGGAGTDATVFDRLNNSFAH